jgi:hypothetical protein
MSDVYDQDLLTWSAQQAALLRRRAAGELVNETDIDWQNVADEIDHLGGNLSRDLNSRLRTILVHLLKLAASPAIDPRPGWSQTIREQRSEIEGLFELAPSLRPTVQAAIEKQLGRASAEVRASLSDYGETPRLEIDGRTFTEHQVLGDWFPDPHR